MAMAKPKTVDRINGIAAVSNKYFNKAFPDRIKDFFNQTLQTIFDERYATDIILEGDETTTSRKQHATTKQTTQRQKSKQSQQKPTKVKKKPQQKQAHKNKPTKAKTKGVK